LGRRGRLVSSSRHFRARDAGKHFEGAEKNTAHCTRHFRNTGKPGLAFTTPR